MSTYKEQESYCEMMFMTNGPYWHVYTPGMNMPVIFGSEEDYVFVMNLVCQAKLSTPDVSILAFEIMSNHVHFLLSGEEKQCRDFFSYFKRRLYRSVKTLSCNELPKTFEPEFKPVETLQALRNTIAYINRNGYVVDRKHTPFSYPWGTSSYYFTAFHVSLCQNVPATDERRRMFRGRSPQIPTTYKVMDGYIVPASYCALEFGHALFRDGHHYFSQISKNIESYNEIAVELKDEDYLTDTELFAHLGRIVKAEYGMNSIKYLSKAQKLDLARRLRFDFQSSNGQIRRLLGLSSAEVDSMFPLSAKQ